MGTVIKNRGTSCVGVCKTGTTLIRVSTVMGTLYCIVEGTAERVIMDKLLENNKLIFSKRELLDQELLKCRNARHFEDRYLGKRFDSKISVYRILDSRREDFKLRKAYVNKVDVINVITAPEIEILVIT